MKKWIRHYESLLVENRSEFANISTNRERPQSNENLQITIEELRCKMKTMKNGRSSGSGGIVSELMKYREEFGQISIIINSCLEKDIKTRYQSNEESYMISIH